MPNEIHLIYGSDDHYWFPTAISASSAVYGCSRAITVHLFDAGVSDEHYLEYERLVKKANADVVCERHRLDAKMFDGYGEWRGSVVTYSRMFIQELLPLPARLSLMEFRRLHSVWILTMVNFILTGLLILP